MTSPESTDLRQRLVSLITHRASSSTDVRAVAAAARRTHDDLAAVLAPLISPAGVEALLARAFDLVQREYPPDGRAEGGSAGESFGRVSVWLERQVASAAIGAAAAIFATFAELLTTLIGEPLTTRYLRKAWPDGFSDARPRGKQA